jgi:hypothetical protein
MGSRGEFQKLLRVLEVTDPLRRERSQPETRSEQGPDERPDAVAVVG